MKSCKVCNEEQPNEAFAKNSKSPDGIHRECRKCAAKRYRFRKENPNLEKKKQNFDHLKKKGPYGATLEMIIDMISYDNFTGKLTWKKKPRYTPIKIGDECGRLCKDGYRELCLNGQFIKSHRAAWAINYGSMPNGEIDHINRNKSDNRIDNLRLASKQQNGFNKPKPANNTTGYKGIRMHKDGRWIARITLYGKNYYLGMHATKEDAAEAYRKKAKEAHKEFYNNEVNQ